MKALFINAFPIMDWEDGRQESDNVIVYSRAGALYQEMAVRRMEGLHNTMTMKQVEDLGDEAYFTELEAQFSQDLEQADDIFIFVLELDYAKPLLDYLVELDKRVYLVAGGDCNETPAQEYAKAHCHGRLLPATGTGGMSMAILIKEAREGRWSVSAS